MIFFGDGDIGFRLFHFTNQDDKEFSPAPQGITFDFRLESGHPGITIVLENKKSQ